MLRRLILASLALFIVLVPSANAAEPRIAANVTADAFCWSMVRSLIGALLAVGEHRREPCWCGTLLASTRRSSDFVAAPARGLTLTGVDYPPDDQLDARTKVTRDLRVVD